MALTVSDVMRTDVRWVSPETRLVDLERLLLAEGISGAPVVDGGKLVGIVSRSDVARQLAVEQTIQETISDFYRQPFVGESSREEGDEIAAGVAARWRELLVKDVMIHGVIGPFADGKLVAA